jgi:hypothetical protein
MSSYRLVSFNGSAGISAPPSGDYSTTFPVAENPISESGKWINGAATGIDWNNVAVASDYAFASAIAAGYNDDIAILVSSYATNQYARSVIYKESGYAPASSHEVELLLRFGISANDAHGYEVLWGISGYVAVVRWNGPVGNYTPIYDPGPGSAPVPSDGDIFLATISGDIITAYVNGSQVASANITSVGGTVYSSGYPGMGFWPQGSAVTSRFGFKDWQSGSF